MDTREDDLFGAFTNLQVRSSAIESLQTNDPSLYASIDASSDNLYKPYAAHPQFEEYEKIGFWKMMLETISLTTETIPDGGEPIDPDPLKEMVRNYEEWTQDAIDEVESYTEENVLRQIIYYNCLPHWSVGEVEEI
ncbi:hypothetical protein HYG81_20600 (plasmid) [Natrinema zhouii]|uniref:hypothetical protein n=1 Tax=Natrinema zhouii TaxID=1710539 RepID=UPI001CFF5FA7|nr:hypothetical protein [Natrinema zhouii]UHQ98023.1 hypothetical protein HYG81_20600 [Natrinema zhouii]